PGVRVMTMLRTPPGADASRMPVVPEPSAPATPDPARLLELSAAGDLDAFARFYDLMAPRAHGLALRVLRDPGYAEETVQGVFPQVGRQASGSAPSLGSAHSGVLTTTHRRAVDRVRSESPPPRRDEADAGAGLSDTRDRQPDV